MMRTTALAASSAKRSLRSLALNVHFKHPDLGMKDYEILSRASAFLLSVDPPEEEVEGRYSHMKKAQDERDRLIHKQNFSPDPAGGPKRDVKDLSWLEFCPGKHRPLTHVVTSSHVLSPWLWKQYYPQPWLSTVTQDHVRYSIDVYDNDNNNSNSNSNNNAKREPLATFALNPFPIHHPSEMDVAIVHLKQEETALKHMESLGVHKMHLRDNETLFDKGDEVIFDGFELADEHYAYMEKMSQEMDENGEKESSEEDTRVFMPYNEKGNLIFASSTRFLTSTATPLPEGLCGGPVIDTDGKICGMVEGIVPVEHEDKNIAGSASFIPSFRLREFMDYAERTMLETILPKKVFDKVVELKEGKALNASAKVDLRDENASIGLPSQNEGGPNLDVMYDGIVNDLRKTKTPEQVEAIMSTIQREQQEVMDIIERDGGDLDEIIATVRAKTRQRQQDILEKLEGERMQEAEIISERNDVDSSPDEKPLKQ